jgi:hypothetical protein
VPRGDPDPRTLREVRHRGGVQVAAESRAFLAERDIEVGGAQTTKTRKALEFFSKELTPRG